MGFEYRVGIQGLVFGVQLKVYRAPKLRQTLPPLGSGERGLSKHGYEQINVLIITVTLWGLSARIKVLRLNFPTLSSWSLVLLFLVEC